MHGDLHYEVVLKATGHYQVFFSDARRAPLPASIASRVLITLTRTGEPNEAVSLMIADDGESWIGAGRPVQSAGVTARVAYEMDGRVYWIDVPFPAAESGTGA